MIIEKLISKRGQISMELGILVAAAVAVAAIAAFYYISNVKNSMEGINETVDITIENIHTTATDYASRLNS